MIQKIFALALLGLFAIPALPAVAQDEPAAEEKKEDIFAVPEGDDAKELELFLRKLARTAPEERTPEGIQSHLNQMDQALEKVLSRKAGVDVYVMASEIRLQILQLLPQFGDEAAVLARSKFLEKLMQDKRPAVKSLAARVELQERISRIPVLPDAAKTKLINEIGEKLKAADKADPEQLQMAVGLAMQTAQTLEQVGDLENAKTAYTSYASILKEKNVRELNDLVKRMEGFVRKMNLPGNPIEIQGTTLAGEEFDIKDWKGKVVLVDFWATWCGPCIAELPNVKRMYEAYHEKGFEIIGISLDNDRESLVNFVEKRELDWPTIFFEEPENQGWENPIANHYGITGIPAVILVNQEGNVVNLNARGEILGEELARLLGPIEESETE